MKAAKFLSIFITLVLICVFAVSSYAEEAKKSDTKEENSPALVDTSDMRYHKTPLNKLGRGFINLATFLAELPAGIYRVSKDKGEIVGVTLGFAEGMVTSFLRAGSALFDVTTCVIPPYDKPLMLPEYALDSFEDSYHELDKVQSPAPRI